MFAGVTYSFFVINGILCAEFFLIFRSVLALLACAAVHLAGMVLCRHEPRFLDLWILRVSRCPRVRNHKLWQCNSYHP